MKIGMNRIQHNVLGLWRVKNYLISSGKYKTWLLLFELFRYHDEVEITEKTTEFTRIEEGDNYKLIIKEVTRELRGKYSCKVVNDLGQDECNSTFTVLGESSLYVGFFLLLLTFESKLFYFKAQWNNVTYPGGCFQESICFISHEL